METKSYQPTDAELEILQIIWELEPVGVRDVFERICVNKDVGYTTVLKQIQRLTEKGVLSRTDAAGTHLYVSKLKEQEVKTDLLDKMIQTAFGGSALKMMMHALGAESTSEEELLALKTWLDQQTPKP